MPSYLCIIIPIFVLYSISTKWEVWTPSSTPFHIFLFHCTFCKYLPISIIFGAQYTEVIWNTTVRQIHLTCILLVHYFGKCWFLVFGLFWHLFHQQSCLDHFETWRWSLTSQRFLLLHTTTMSSWMLMQEMLHPFVALLWCWHLARQCASTLMCASDNRVIAAFTGSGFDSLLTIYACVDGGGSYCNIWTLLDNNCAENWIFFSMCNHNI